MKRTLVTLFLVLGLYAIASSVSAQSDAQALRERQGFSLEIAAGVVGIDEFESNQAAFVLNVTESAPIADEIRGNGS